MIRTRISRLRPLAALTAALSLGALSSGAAAQDDTGGPPPPGLDREQMWYAPTAEDWAKPCLITWQRTWEDAVAVSQETKKPILVCTNMDGEIASEHYAGIRYRMADIAKLYEPYVTVIASVYRHNPRDFDEEGNRILCPRFGTVTCGEHIVIEPGLYEKFMDGRRIAPRHIMVELNGEETYDVFYAWDTDSVFKAISDGITNREIQAPPVVRGDRSIVDRVASRDVVDREAVEAAYGEGDNALKSRLLDAAKQHAEAEPVDLLRLGVFGLDVELSKTAREALADSTTDRSTGLITDALTVPMETDERDSLIDALEKIGEKSPKAATLAVVHRGLTKKSRAVDVQNWSAELEGAAASLVASYELESRLRQQDKVLETGNPEELVKLAEAFLSRALEAKFEGVENHREQDYARFMFMDARRTAQEAQKVGADGWADHAVIALASYYLVESEFAHEHAEKAVNALPTGEASYNAMAVLELFAKLRCQAIAKHVKDKTEWPGEWLTDVNAACSVLAKHPLGTADQIAWHYDILQWLGGKGQAGRVLEEGLARFPTSAALHLRLRGQIMRQQGIAGLEGVYARMLEAPDASPDLLSFAGFASMITAEVQRRRGNDQDAVDAYGRAIAYYEKFGEIEVNREYADHQIALALAGKGRIALEQGEYEIAVNEILASFQQREASAATLDGLNLSAVDTAKMLLSTLKAANNDDLAAKLQTALDGLDPALLALPAYEFEVGPDGQRVRQGQGRGGRRRGGDRGNQGGGGDG